MYVLKTWNKRRICRAIFCAVAANSVDYYVNNKKLP